MTIKEFMKWQEQTVKRIKDDNKRSEYRAGLICAVMANINKGKSKKQYKPQDFMAKEKIKLTTEQIYNRLKAITLMAGGEVKCQERG